VKKKILFFLIFCICILTACSSDSIRYETSYGKVIEKNSGSFVIQTSENEKIGFFMTDSTNVFSFFDEINPEDFRIGLLTDIAVSVHYTASRKSMVTQEGEKIKAYKAHQVDIDGYKKNDVVTLKDVAIISIWQYRTHYCYLLPDGTNLMQVNNPIVVYDGVSIGGVDGINNLEETAGNNIHNYYQKQGILYDEKAELEKAYDVYLKSVDKSLFYSMFLSQSIVSTAENDTLIWFETLITLPTYDKEASYEEYHRVAVFDKESGKYIDACELFSCSKEKAIQKMLEIAEISDPILVKEMIQAFDSDALRFSPTGLLIHFNRGTLPSRNLSFSFSLDYDDRLMEILHEWAVPENRNNEGKNHEA